MKDVPLILNTPWGKGQRLNTGCWIPKENNSAYGPLKKEKPRGNGALKGKKI